jgi:hypothetical protein
MLMINFNLQLLKPAQMGAAVADRLQEFYAQYFLGLIGERVPPWLDQGVRKLIGGMCCTEDAIEFPALTTDQTLGWRKAGSADDLPAALAEGNFMTLEQLFSTTAPLVQRYRTLEGGDSMSAWDWIKFPRMGRPDEPPLMTFHLDGSHKALWVVQPFGPFVDESYEFTQFCLFGAREKYRSAFIKFAQAAANGPLDEANFNGFFGLDYREMLLDLWQYTDIGRDWLFRLSPSAVGQLAPLSPVEFRPAAASEIERIKAQYRMEEGAVSTGFGATTP